MDRLKIALVGAGRRGAGAHLPVIAAMEDVFDLVAICDMDAATAQSLADKHGVRAYTSVRDLVDAEDLDIADVVVPSGAHHALSCFLSQAGVHQLVETPIAMTRPAADLMVRTAREAGVYFEVAENYYRAPIERLKKSVLTSNVIGTRAVGSRDESRGECVYRGQPRDHCVPVARGDRSRARYPSRLRGAIQLRVGRCGNDGGCVLSEELIKARATAHHPP